MWRRRGAPGVVECGSEIIRWQLEMRNSGNKQWIRSGRRSEAMAHFVFFCGLLLATAFLVIFLLFSFFLSCLSSLSLGAFHQKVKETESGVFTFNICSIFLASLELYLLWCLGSGHLPMTTTAAT